MSDRYAAEPDKEVREKSSRVARQRKFKRHRAPFLRLETAKWNCWKKRVDNRLFNRSRRVVASFETHSFPVRSYVREITRADTETNAFVWAFQLSDNNYEMISTSSLFI